MANLSVVFLLIFAYIPMFGVLFAFKDLDFSINIIPDFINKPFVGFKKFTEFFTDRQFNNIMLNTLGLNIIKLCVSFPLPILLALLLNEVRTKRFRKTVQAITSFPHFVSWAIFGGLVLTLISADGGAINSLLVTVRILEKPINFATKPQFFWAIAITAGITKGIGWGSIIYLAAIAGVDQQLYESAVLDGANRRQMALHITLPCIIGTIIVLLLFNISGILGNSFEEFYILQNSLNISRSEVLTTFIYKVGISQRKYSYTTAVGLFSSAVGILLLTGSNIVAKRVTGRGLYN